MVKSDLKQDSFPNRQSFELVDPRAAFGTMNADDFQRSHSFVHLHVGENLYKASKETVIK